MSAGMQFGQAVVRNLQLHPTRRIGFDEVDELPRNDAAAESCSSSACSADERHHALQQPAHRAARADVDRADLQDEMSVAALFVDVDVVHAHDLAPMNVDDLLVEQVALQQEQPIRLGFNPFRSRRGRLHRAVYRHDGRKRQQPVAVFGPDDEIGYSCPVIARGEYHFAHTPANLAGSLDHRLSQQFGKRKRAHIFRMCRESRCVNNHRDYFATRKLEGFSLFGQEAEIKLE